MHGRYRHVSRDERGKIMFMSRWGKNCSEIAALLGRHRSTILRELRRNVSQYDSCYTDESAQIWADRRRDRASHRGRLRDAGIRPYVEEKLKVGWSPELIAGRIRLDLPGLRISHETIYQYIYHLELPERQEYIGYLARSHRRRRKRGAGKRQRKSRIPNRISIDDRPKAVGLRKQMGHWEGDSMVSSRNTTVLYSLVERRTRLLKLVRVRGRDGKRAAVAIIRRLGPLPKRARRTLTMDNGFEHRHHERITAAIDIHCYFCDPYTAW
jgi:IS30 family transposase